MFQNQFSRFSGSLKIISLKKLLNCYFAGRAVLTTIAQSATTTKLY